MLCIKPLIFIPFQNFKDPKKAVAWPSAAEVGGVQAEGASMITLTGWVAGAAVAAMLLVVVLGAFVGLRRLLGKRTQHYTVITPRDGDA